MKDTVQGFRPVCKDSHHYVMLGQSTHILGAQYLKVHLYNRPLFSQVKCCLISDSAVMADEEGRVSGWLWSHNKPHCLFPALSKLLRYREQAYQLIMLKKGND